MNKAPAAVRRQIFVLTPEEKKALCFVGCALVLGFSAKQYRASHPISVPAPTSALHPTHRKVTTLHKPRRPRVKTAPPATVPNSEEKVTEDE